MINKSTKKLIIGLVINPWAGVGGSVALKGSDGEEIREKALSLGAIPEANQRVKTALKMLTTLNQSVEFLTVSGNMGANSLQQLGFDYRILFQVGEKTSATDTIKAIELMENHRVDLIAFAGGDGTARDVFDGITKGTLVLGIPAGTKIHSGVYCINPQAAGELISKVIEGKIIEIATASVMDIDEDLFRQGRVQAKLYGELKIPFEPLLVQQVKSASQVDESINQLDIAEGICKDWESDHLYIVGSGSTLQSVMAQLKLKNTLLGIDVVLNHQVIANDVSAEKLLNLLNQYKNISSTLLITVIGGQGHLFGRGNQQLSHQVLRTIGKSNIIILATKKKMAQLKGRPFIADSGSDDFDQWLAGRYSVRVDYNETWLYPLGEDSIHHSEGKGL